jgi:hypothetical protein
MVRLIARKGEVYLTSFHLGLTDHVTLIDNYILCQEHNYNQRSEEKTYRENKTRIRGKGRKEAKLTPKQLELLSFLSLEQC